MSLWRAFKAWLDREAELIAADTWAPCTSADPAVQQTLARLNQARAQMAFDKVPTLLEAGRKRWRQPVQFKARPVLVMVKERK